jgi:hypothetical protein
MDSHQTHEKNSKNCFYFRVISWFSWPTLRHKGNSVSFSITLAVFLASEGAET